ncbi:hypothetical protein AGR2A_Lc80087 [Agrobacterium genomosp. 2 str. CFBP 5494]|uniref:Uncharacterized protein n=1 Tax=Agrobacterium genomosp. 2 str. CFBP 5494 TaxID=1183436 RepID=A0A9W5B5V4_9HYPH|nr:hypothetical protein AGR2A_Lc80087 [Agrobacterium genomosp. 2 str. CFBP 5494]
MQFRDTIKRVTSFSIETGTPTAKGADDDQGYQGPAPRYLDGVGCAAEQQLLHRYARPAPGKEDRQLRRAKRLSPLLR